MMFTVAHELTHFIRQWSPAKFRVLANFLFDYYGYKGLKPDSVEGKMVADTMSAGHLHLNGSIPSF